MRIDWDESAVRELAFSADMHDLMERAGELVADHARDLSPSGPDSRSAREGIVTETVLGPNGWESHVGHITHAYGFHLARRELGTRFQSPAPHLRPAATMRIDL